MRPNKCPGLSFGCKNKINVYNDKRREKEVEVNNCFEENMTMLRKFVRDGQMMYDRLGEKLSNFENEKEQCLNKLRGIVLIGDAQRTTCLIEVSCVFLDIKKLHTRYANDKNILVAGKEPRVVSGRHGHSIFFFDNECVHRRS